MTSIKSKTSGVRVIAAWTVVTIPLAWGVYQTVVKSLPLFRAVEATRPASISGR